jgi:hypothetical protein
MKIKLIIISLVLVITAFSCNLPGSGMITETPAVVTSEPHSLESTPTSTKPPVEMPAETTPVSEVTPQPAPALPVVYGNRTVDPAEVVLIDPGDGTELQRISAPGLGYGGFGGASRSSVVYVEEDFQKVYHLLFDGTLQELDFLNPEGEVLDGVFLPSPDGLRIAHGAVLSFDPSGDHVQLVVVNIDGSGEQILVDEHQTDRLTRPTPIKWSTDGDHLYFMNVFVGVGGYGGTDLHRVEIATGSSEILLADQNCLCSTSVSPDEARAVRAVKDDHLSLVIKNLDTGVEERLDFPTTYTETWEMVWAPDSSALLVTLGLGDWEADQYSLAKVDMESLEISFLFTEDDRLMRPMAWHVMETIWLNDRDGNLWRMDAASQALTLVATDAWVIPYSQ